MCSSVWNNILCKISDADLHQLRHSEGRYAQFISDICKFYRDWHVKSDGVYGNLPLISFNIVKFPNLNSLSYLLQFSGNHLLDRLWSLITNAGIFLHDPVSFAALVRPDLFTYKEGVVRVETQGICLGHTLMDQGLKMYFRTNAFLWVHFSCFY